MFRWFMRVFVQGLAAAIPITLTVAIVIWLGVMIEGMVSYMVDGAIPSLPDLLRMLKGLAAFIIVVFLFGLLMKLWLVRHLYDWVEAKIIQVPLVKTVYGAIKDVMGLLKGKSAKGDMVVVVTLENGWRQLGIVTRQDFSNLPPELVKGDRNLVAVYLPFSYQLGGFTYFIDRRVCEPVPGMSVEDAMRVSIMAWVGEQKSADSARTAAEQSATDLIGKDKGQNP